MKRAVWAIAAVVAGLAEGASAQVHVTLGGGPSVPLGGFGDVAEVGGLGVLGVSLELDALTAIGAEIGVEALYGRNPHAISGNRSSLYGARVLARYTVARLERLEVFIRGDVGAVVHSRASEQFPDLDASERGLAVSLGAGVSFPLRSVTPFVSGGYTTGLGDLNSTAFPTELLEVRAGVSVPLRL